MRVAALVAVAVVLAGCTTDGPDSGGGGPALPDRPALSFDEPLLVAPGGDVEATVHVTAEGHILVCSHGGFYQPSPMWASTDGGATFERIDPQPNPVPSGDCDLTSHDGAWNIVYDTIASATVGVSEDAGRTWELNPASALPIAVDRPWIKYHGDELYMTYSDVMVAEPALQVFARSTDGGRTWLEHTPINIAEPPDDLQAVIGRMAIHEDTVRVPLARSNIQTGGPLSLDYAVSHDRGQTWGLESVYGPYDPGGLVLPTSTVANGTWYYTVNQANGTLNDIEVVISHDGGETWTDPVRVAAGVDLPGVVGPWIEGRSDGTATFAWVERVEAGWTVAAARVAPDGMVDGPVLLAEPVDRDQGIGHEFIMVDHMPDGRAVVAWPMDTGPACDPDPNEVEDRGSQCIYVAFERLA